MKERRSRKLGLPTIGWLSALVLSVLGTTPTLAQAQAQDYPMYMGNPSRQGKAGDPLASSAGIANLRWFTPFGTENTTGVEVDNTDTADAWTLNPTDPFGYVGGPYTSLTNGQAVLSPRFDPQSVANNFALEWARPTTAGSASMPYLLPRRRAAVGPNVVDLSSREPSYVFTRCTPSAVGTDPTVAQNPADRRFIEWQIQGRPGTRQNFALYAWLPIGGTTLPSGQTIFPQRYFVYEIIYGNNQRAIDVVDTYAGGTGFVRLGNGGRPSDVIFPYDGFNRIRVRLYNTVPRDAAGNLTMPAPVTNYVVYGDAFRGQPSTGSYTASPVVAGGGTANIRAIGAMNAAELDVDTAGNLFNRIRGVVTSYNHDFNNVNLINNYRWNYIPTVDNSGEGAIDNESAGVVIGPGWTLQTNSFFLNGNYRSLPATISNSFSTVTYNPTLADGTYDVFVYLPGNRNGINFANKVRYIIREQTTGGPVDTTVVVDQSRRLGWARLGTRRFAHTAARPLQVIVTNRTNDTLWVNFPVYADGVRFVGQANIKIDSTPVQTVARLRLPDTTLADRRVVIVADETGRIHCLDAVGRGDGTTDIYWKYPSERRSGFTDPNLTEGIDGRAVPPPTPDSVPVAEMPSGFDTSSALVQRISGRDYLFIASRNGRIYCLDMEGRGDYNTTTRTPGTTRRIWTYPDDFPGIARASNLGAFTGSLTYAVTAQGPTIFAPTTSGRILALNALPTDLVNVTNRTTTLRWMYPAASDQPLGPITSTPTVEFGRVYFGANQRNESFTQFHALNADTGAVVWQFPTNAQLGTAAKFQTLGWTASPTTATALQLGGGMPNTVFAMNENRYLFALDAATGGELWSTNEPISNSVSGLTFTNLSVFDNSGTGTRVVSPVVLLPTQSGRFTAYFARTGDTNRNGGRRAWEYITNAENIRSAMAAGNNHLYGNDTNGFMYAFSNNPGAPVTPGIPPGQETIVENNPIGDVFRQAKVAFIRASTYNALRLATGESGHPDFNTIIDPATRQVRPEHLVNRSAFEWGETVYIFVYDYPMLNEVLRPVPPPGSGTALVQIPPPQVNFALSVDGTTSRNLPVESRQFTEPPNAPPNAVDGALRNNAYAVLPFTFQGGGVNALPPGSAEVLVSISTQAFNNANALQNVTLDPALTARTFTLANPLAISMELLGGTFPQPNPSYSIGTSKDPSANENLVNGSPQVAGLPGNTQWLLKSAGIGTHGGTAKARIWVTDRSMMGTIRPDGRGLENVRVNLNGLAWQGQGSTIYKALDPALYPGFEDLPVNLPNTSLDYPDISPGRITVTKDPDGNAENPLFISGGVSLPSPLINAGGIRPIANGDDPLLRIYRPVPFDFDISVPRFQPPNNARVGYTGSRLANLAPGTVGDPRFYQPDSAGNLLDQGYLGRMAVYVDSNQNNAINAGEREAFRAFTLATAVAPDERISIVTPNVDPNADQGTVNLGALAGGTGYMLNPSVYSPFTAPFQSLFQRFTVLNEGNVNLLNVRLAKRLNTPTGVSGWPITGSAIDSQAWLDGSLDLWSNFDARFAPTYSGINRQIVQKPRVTDTVPTQLLVNPRRRVNANLGITDSPLIPGQPSFEPTVSVTVPFGFPAGNYSQLLRVIENANLNPNDETWDRTFSGNVATASETFSDPTLRLIFNVRETRLTNRFSTNTDVQLDNLIGPGAPLAYKNVQPTGMRTQEGHLVTAWASNRPTDTPTPGAPTAPLAIDPWRIYFGSLQNGATFDNSGTSTPGGAGFSPIRDLNFWIAGSANSWFRKSGVSGSGYPGVGTNFGALFGQPVLAGSEKFFFPTFPTAGRLNPLEPETLSSSFTQTVMAMVGEASPTADPAASLSQVFAAVVQTSNTGEVTSVGAPIPVPGEVATRKGRPAVVQTSSGAALVLYPATSGNTTRLNVARFNGGAWENPIALNMGSAFESVRDVSAVLRTQGGTPAVDVVFTARLVGNQNFEVFRGRIPLTAGLTIDPSVVADPFRNNVVRVNEVVTPIASGVYRTLGSGWLRTAPVTVSLQIGNGPLQNLARPNTTVIDPQTGAISFESILGGRVYLNPSTGRIQISGSVPPRNATLFVTYVPRFVRLSAGNGSYLQPTVVFDARRTSDGSYWVPSDPADARLRSDRLIVGYIRQGGGNQAPRPATKTMRIGLQLAFPILTNNVGVVTGLTVTGNTGPYQVDPANGRVYFTRLDEGRNITITYAAADVSTGTSLGNFTQTSSAEFIDETEENFVPIEQAVNESSPFLFLDPFDPQTADLRQRRPALYWLLWTSTRAGVPDVYTQTIAPKILPVPLGR